MICKLAKQEAKGAHFDFDLCAGVVKTVLCNSAETNPSGLVRQVADIVLAKDLKATQPTPVKEPVKGSGSALTAEQMARRMIQQRNASVFGVRFRRWSEGTDSPWLSS